MKLVSSHSSPKQYQAPGNPDIFFLKKEENKKNKTKVKKGKRSKKEERFGILLVDLLETIDL